MNKGDLIIFKDNSRYNVTDSRDNYPTWKPPYEDKLGLILKPGGVKSSYVYFFGLCGSDQRIWNLSHSYLKLVSRAE